MSTLPQTVASVLAQQHAQFEHIFVDGGSTDGTLDYIRSLPHAPRILEDVGGGIARAMNAGAELARGDHLCHLHSDDYFLHDHVLQRVTDHFAQSEAQWLFGRILFDQGGALMPEPFIVPDYSFQRLINGNFIPHPASFVGTALFRELGGFRSDLKYAMDYEFFLRLGRRAPPLALKEALAVFRIHPGSTTVKNRLASFEEDHAVRLSFAGRSWREQLMHAARYHVRRRRLLAQMAQD